MSIFSDAAQKSMGENILKRIEHEVEAFYVSTTGDYTGEMVVHIVETIKRIVREEMVNE